jgi:predicted DNA-binding transcriptional regulator YafY
MNKLTSIRKRPYSDQQRILRLYSQLIAKRELSIEAIADTFFVSHKTVQRDIKNLREFLDDLQFMEDTKSKIIFDRKKQSYKLTNVEHLFEVFNRINGLID